MKKIPYKSTHRIIIDPGEYYVSTQQEIISTLLGSCVSACLYDPVNKVIGMNHFLLAHRHNAHNHQALLETEEARYGMYAMELLINAMLKKGANKLNLKAKCFGGGNVLRLREDTTNKQTVGDLNITFIKEFLKNEKIPLLGSSLGGNSGRNIHFIGTDFSVYVKPIDPMVTQKLEKEERQYWKKSISEQKQQEQTSNQIDYF